MPDSKGSTSDLDLARNGRRPHYWKDPNGELWYCIREPLDRQRTDGRTISHSLLNQKIPRHPYRLALYRCLGCLSDATEWAYSHHVIDMSRVSAITRGMPRFLFRVYSEKNAGDNRPGCFRSEREKRGLGGEFEDMSEQDIRDSLLGHMASRRKHFASPWISLSYSVLWLMAKVLRLIQEGHNINTLQIAIIDSLDLPHGVHLYHAGALLSAYDVENKMVYRNMGRSMALVWKEIKAPMAVILVKDFLPDLIGKDYIRPGYLSLQPFHEESVDAEFVKRFSALQKLLKPNDKDQRHEGKEARSTNLTPASSNPSPSDQAPKLYYKKYVAKRYPNKEFRPEPTDLIKGISSDEMADFVDLVKRNVSDPKFQLPVLVFLLSTRTNQFYPDSIVDQIGELNSTDPMIQEHQKCFVRSNASDAASVPEILSFEPLYRDCCERLGITIHTFDYLPRNFRVLASPHTRIPNITPDSLKYADICETQNSRRLREKQELAETRTSPEQPSVSSKASINQSYRQPTSKNLPESLLISSATIPKTETNVRSVTGDLESSKPASMKRGTPAEEIGPEPQQKRMCIAPAGRARSTLTATLEDVTGCSWSIPTSRKAGPLHPVTHEERILNENLKALDELEQMTPI
ncbi:hypothetical protein LTR47_009131 [Exophiala xenobiotica]|nr:hypothetical protein LTR41_004363 [Exophiala xenobiotica]KAK5225603.1 hypothetical protein LTR72_003506 [Exophiala xenobiotica]KAK5226453.1 hypothetical protein LTR47_009131 [Exophiala xenobiotica]KAK5253898.1 hypothetical protein LTS06_001704 [Exophiala xenobiotica]KAK5284480.1 hypothetical protein LTR40_000150 [Exophiala xenobiotica]